MPHPYTLCATAPAASPITLLHCPPCACLGRHAASQLSFADPDACTWRWSAKRVGSTEWEDRPCASQFYTPGPEDEGCVLRVECVPGAWRRDAGQGDVWRGEAVSAVTGGCGRGGARRGWMEPGLARGIALISVS